MEKDEFVLPELKSYSYCSSWKWRRFYWLYGKLGFSKFLTLVSEVDLDMKLSTSGLGQQGHAGVWFSLKYLIHSFVSGQVFLVCVCFQTGEKCLNSELWHACAGPLVSLPSSGSRVVYFPQGHSEQVQAFLLGLKIGFLCEVLLFKSMELYFFHLFIFGHFHLNWSVLVGSCYN